MGSDDRLSWSIWSGHRRATEPVGIRVLVAEATGLCCNVRQSLLRAAYPAAGRLLAGVERRRRVEQRPERRPQTSNRPAQLGRLRHRAAGYRTCSGDSLM